MYLTPTHTTWASMIRRCGERGQNAYAGRGIKVCARWLKFENFLADMGERPTGMSIDRIDNNGDYEPGNCRWANRHEQANNRRSSLILKFCGESKTLIQWAHHLGVAPEVIGSRLKRGWSVERALDANRHTSKLLTFNGVTLNTKQWAGKVGITPEALGSRIRSGWTIEKALTTGPSEVRQNAGRQRARNAA
jgi:hypothetical protein